MNDSSSANPLSQNPRQNFQMREDLKPGMVIDIPVEGSLGLLALGAEGLLAWRAVRNKKQKTTDDKRQTTDVGVEKNP